ncbi:MAG TPA: EAL domain-containing protein [Candidatus Solibacter sp.]|nr:EAL domain-containing protein [Candidatus Solibacter sp.]
MLESAGLETWSPAASARSLNAVFRRRLPQVVSADGRIRVSLLALWGATALMVLVYLASTLLRARSGSGSFYDVWVGNAGYAGCALMCGWRAVVIRRQRFAWGAIALGLAFFTGGAVLWTTLVQYWNPVPYPSVSDLSFLCVFPVMYVGVGMLVRGALPRASGAIWLDGLIAALGVAALEATGVIGAVSSASHGDFATVATNIAYPIGDLVLVSMVVAAFAIQGWRPGRMWWLLGTGLAIFAAADSVYVLRVTDGTYTTGTPLDSLWLIGTFLIASAAWREPAGRPEPVRRTQPIFVPALFLMSSLGIIVYGTWHQVHPLELVLATTTLLTAFLRSVHGYRQLRVLAESKREARTDELTGLPNRRFFFEALNAHMAASPDGERVSVLMLDLDRFKEINDSLGHHVGDDLLRELGPRLATVVNGDGVVARLGGDEFGLFLTKLENASDATGLAERVCEVLREPFVLETMTLRLDASIGIAVAPEHGRRVETLLQKADLAMYSAKRGHRAWELYSAAKDFDSLQRLQLMQDLPGAIDRDEIILHYQPLFDLASGQTTGVEALARWQHPTRGLLGPAEFLGLVDESGLIGPFAETVLDQALAQQAEWLRAGIQIQMAVNLSAANLRDEDLASKVSAAMARHGGPAGRLTIEITEDCLMADADQGLRILQQIHALGVEISVDDYGTGFSSLAYLRNLPIHQLKLDRAFLVGVPGDTRATSIVRSTVQLAHSLGLRLVAEGIEAPETLAAVQALGCDLAQGFLIGRPVAADQISGALPAHRALAGVAAG